MLGEVPCRPPWDGPSSDFNMATSTAETRPSLPPLGMPNSLRIVLARKNAIKFIIYVIRFSAMPHAHRSGWPDGGASAHIRGIARKTCNEPLMF